ncbi:MAG TPA: hypothetical protein VIU93_03875 [Gallionellaceae bacterium]
MVFRSLSLTFLLLLAGCSQTSLLSKQDYQRSQQYFLKGDVDEALLNFPRGAEERTFITTMEKSYLNLIQGKPQIKALQQQADVLEDRVRYHVTREAKTFFYLQTPEDYYASEHEVIWLHFLLSWGYSLQGQPEAACVEAREASSLLSLPWSPNGHFDDPAMRLVLAGLWAMCGEWREAQVDLRAAWMMDNSLTWARDLAQRDKAPAQLFMILGGPGPEVLWSPEFRANPLRSERRVEFRLRGQRSTLSLRDQNGEIIPAYLSPSAAPWYERHLVRESELHELILDSAYGGKVAMSGSVASMRIAATTGAGIAIGLGGTVLGGAIMYAGVQSGGSGADAALKLGLLIAAASIAKGIEVSKQGYDESTRQFKREVDPSIHYRFVRYLPEYLWMAWSDHALAFPVQLQTPFSTLRLQQPTVAGKTSVSVAFVPDVNRRSGGALLPQ